MTVLTSLYARETVQLL